MIVRSIFTVAIVLAATACGNRETVYDVAEHERVRYTESRDENVIGQNAFARMARQDPQRHCKALPHKGRADLEQLTIHGRIVYGNSTMTNTMLLEGSVSGPKIVWQQIDDRGIGYAPRTVTDSCYFVPAA